MIKERKNSLKFRRTKVELDRAQKSREIDSAIQKSFLTKDIYTRRNRALTAPIMGMTVVASTAAPGDWVQPMKKREIRAVEGRPVMRPPIFVPCLSASRVAVVTQAPPTRKERTNFIRKISVISVFK